MPRTSSVACALAGLLALAAAGCDRPADLDAAPTTSPRPAASTPSPLPVPPSRPPVTLPPTGAASGGPPSFAETTAVACNGYPTADQVLALLRRRGVLPAGATITVRTAPQCAGEWQYTVVSVPEREPLQVVTRGRPTSLELITAGTDVCGVQVRTAAPFGIRTLANCS